MRRTLTALLIAAALTGCAGPTEAETAYLNERRAASTLIDIDESAELDRGHTICGVLANTKPEDRMLTASLLGNQGYPLAEVYTAGRHLCPDLGVRPSWEQ